MTNRKREMERLTEDINRAYESLSASREEKNRSETEIGTLQADIQGLEAQCRERTQVRQEKEHDAVRRRDDLAAVRNEINDLRQRSRTHEKTISDIQEKLHACEMEMERLNENRRSMVERIWERYEKDLASLSDAETRLDVDEATAKERIEVLKKRLKAIGPNVNLSVLEDYETEKASFDELSRHKADLEEAKDKLEKLIRRLDREASEKFMATFNQVRENFMRVFLELFDGGEADIRLEEDPDPLKAKIAVYARPSGKGMKSISLLSGGERALTATSLLFGLYLVKRSPYCILDEVDGPLDDANIGRFVKLIRHFSRETQFLIITHNKKTMVACDILYGVTLAEPGISKLVSVNLSTQEDEKKLDALIGQSA
jgi:chromosome segregation protein